MAVPQKLDTRFAIHDLTRRNGHAEFARDIRQGLSAKPKHLFPKYLYDEVGSRLFETICEVDEYYLTRAEDEILTAMARRSLSEFEISEISSEMRARRAKSKAV